MALPKYETLLLTRHDPDDSVVVVSLNRPSKINAMNAAFWREFRECFQALAADSSVRAIVVAGKGRHFTAGLDLMDGAQSDQTNIVGNSSNADDDGPDTARKGLRLLRVVAPMQETFTAMERCTQPVIAAVHGACVGGGIDLITACDIRFAAPNAFFQVKEVDVGIVADVGTLQRLPKCVGSASLVRELCYTGRRMRADEALRCGLVSRVADAGGAGARDHARHAAAVLRDALGLAAAIAAKSPVAVARRSSAEHLVATKALRLHSYGLESHCRSVLRNPTTGRDQDRAEPRARPHGGRRPRLRAHGQHGVPADGGRGQGGDGVDGREGRPGAVFFEALRCCRPAPVILIEMPEMME